MKKSILLLVSVLVGGTLSAQTIKDRLISCVNGIPLECLYTGDMLKGKNVNYEVRKSDRFLFLRNVNNRCDTLRVDGVLGENVREVNIDFDSLKNNILKAVYDHLTGEEIAGVIREDASLYVHCVLDSSLRAREVVFVLPKHFCDYDDHDRQRIDSACSKLSDIGIPAETVDMWREMCVKTTIGSDRSKDCFWRTFPVDRFREIEKEIIAKARLNEDDDGYQRVIKYSWWKSYFMVEIHPRLLDKMRENRGVTPDRSVFYDIFRRPVLYY